MKLYFTSRVWSGRPTVRATWSVGGSALNNLTFLYYNQLLVWGADENGKYYTKIRIQTHISCHSEASILTTRLSRFPDAITYVYICLLD